MTLALGTESPCPHGCPLHTHMDVPLAQLLKGSNPCEGDLRLLVSALSLEAIHHIVALVQDEIQFGTDIPTYWHTTNTKFKVQSIAKE